MKVHNRITSNEQKNYEKFIKRKDDSDVTKINPIHEKIPKPSASYSKECECDESITYDNTLISEFKKKDKIFWKKNKNLIISQLKKLIPKTRRWDLYFIIIYLTMYDGSLTNLEGL